MSRVIQYRGPDDTSRAELRHYALSGRCGDLPILHHSVPQWHWATFLRTVQEELAGHRTKKTDCSLLSMRQLERFKTLLPL